MSIFKRKRNLVIAGVVMAGLIGAGSLAYAAFSNVTQASAGGNSATMKTLNVGPTSINFPNGETGLWPDVDSNGDEPNIPTNGHHISTISVQVINPNEVPVKVGPGGITGTVGFNDGNVANQCNRYLGLSSTLTLISDTVIIPPGQASTLTVSYVYLDGTAPTVCASQAFTTNLSITGQAV